MGYVGVPVWMWTPEAQWEPRSVTAAIPGLSVTVVGQLKSITWAMGDGSTVTCRTPGKPYKVAYGVTKSPECGYVYEHPSGGQPGQQYKVTATASYAVTWSGAATGQDQVSVSASTPMTIGEIQVLITR